MPTYEYKCDACGAAFEKFQSIKAAPIRKCPNCRKNRVRRLIGRGAGLIFKGSGFYITDYRSESYKNAAKSDSGTPSPSTTTGTESGGNGAAKPAPSAQPSKTESKAPAKPAAKSSPSKPE